MHVRRLGVVVNNAVGTRSYMLHGAHGSGAEVVVRCFVVEDVFVKKLGYLKYNMWGHLNRCIKKHKYFTS